MFSGAKPNIKKRITRAIANVISWLRLGNLSAAPTAIIESPKIQVRQQKKNAVRQYLLPPNRIIVNVNYRIVLPH